VSTPAQRSARGNARVRGRISGPAIGKKRVEKAHSGEKGLRPINKAFERMGKAIRKKYRHVVSKEASKEIGLEQEGGGKNKTHSRDLSVLLVTNAVISRLAEGILERGVWCTGTISRGGKQELRGKKEERKKLKRRKSGES